MEAVDQKGVVDQKVNAMDIEPKSGLRTIALTKVTTWDDDAEFPPTHISFYVRIVHGTRGLITAHVDPQKYNETYLLHPVGCPSVLEVREGSIRNAEAIASGISNGCPLQLFECIPYNQVLRRKPYNLLFIFKTTPEKPFPVAIEAPAPQKSKPAPPISRLIDYVLLNDNQLPPVFDSSMKHCIVFTNAKLGKLAIVHQHVLKTYTYEEIPCPPILHIRDKFAHVAHQLQECIMKHGVKVYRCLTNLSGGTPVDFQKFIFECPIDKEEWIKRQEWAFAKGLQTAHRMRSEHKTTPLIPTPPISVPELPLQVLARVSEGVSENGKRKRDVEGMGDDMLETMTKLMQSQQVMMMQMLESVKRQRTQ
jgi:hypothetical protein